MRNRLGLGCREPTRALPAGSRSRSSVRHLQIRFASSEHSRAGKIRVSRFRFQRTNREREKQGLLPANNREQGIEYRMFRGFEGSLPADKSRARKVKGATSEQSRAKSGSTTRVELLLADSRELISEKKWGRENSTDQIRFPRGVSHK